MPIQLINITAHTTQADLVLAFGTATTYFAAVIAFDGGVWIENLEPRKGAIFGLHMLVSIE